MNTCGCVNSCPCCQVYGPPPVSYSQMEHDRRKHEEMIEMFKKVMEHTKKLKEK